MFSYPYADYKAKIMLYFKITIYGQIKLPVLAKIFIAIRLQTFPLFGHTIIENLQLSIFFYLPVPTFSAAAHSISFWLSNYTFNILCN